MPYNDPKAKYAQNPELYKARTRAYRKAHPGSASMYAKAYYKAHPEKRRARDARQERKGCETLSERYVRKLLSKHTNTKPSEWPQELVAAKTAELKLRRYFNGYYSKTEEPGSNT